MFDDDGHELLAKTAALAFYLMGIWKVFFFIYGKDIIVSLVP